MNFAFLPSPPISEIHLGPLPLRGYSLMVLLGVVAAVWLGGRRFAARAGEPSAVADVALWAVPFGIVGARAYHLITSNGPYFGAGGDPVNALSARRRPGREEPGTLTGHTSESAVAESDGNSPASAVADTPRRKVRR